MLGLGLVRVDSLRLCLRHYTHVDLCLGQELHQCGAPKKIPRGQHPSTARKESQS